MRFTRGWRRVPAVDKVMQREAHTAFSLMRPPGHHAEPDRAMGFCLFSSAAVAACHAREIYGLSRVAVVDFDVHHGNGTQACFWDEAGLFYASSHQMPLFPGTGSRSETGAHKNISTCRWRPEQPVRKSSKAGVMICCRRLRKLPQN